MPVDYDKLLELDYTVHEHAQDFQRDLDENGLEFPSIEVEPGYEDGEPFVEVTATDMVNGKSHSDRYFLEDVTEEEAEDVMFDIYETAMKDLEV